MCDLSTYEALQTAIVGFFALVGIMGSYGWVRGDIKICWDRPAPRTPSVLE